MVGHAARASLWSPCAATSTAYTTDAAARSLEGRAGMILGIGVSAAVLAAAVYCFLYMCVCGGDDGGGDHGAAGKKGGEDGEDGGLEREFV